MRPAHLPGIPASALACRCTRICASGKEADVIGFAPLSAPASLCSGPQRRRRIFRPGGEYQHLSLGSSGLANHACRLQWLDRCRFQALQRGTSRGEDCFLIGTIRPLLRNVQPIVLCFDRLPKAPIRAMNWLHISDLPICHAAIGSTGVAASISRNSPAGQFSISRMGLDMRSSSSSSAGLIAWAGIRRKISMGSDRGVLESRSSALSESGWRPGRTRLQGALRASGNRCRRFAVGFRCTRWIAAELMPQICAIGSPGTSRQRGFFG
jgi:hypothetical protein